MKKADYSVTRAFAKNDENKALLWAAKKLKVSVTELEPDHTEKHYCFNKKSDLELYTVEKTEDYSLQNAKEEAYKALGTFAGNIKVQEEDETHIVFSKIR